MVYTFMDFCAGIGCGRMGLQNAGFECVAFSEINDKSEKTYRIFFGNQEKNYGDLMQINPENLPDFDLLIAGFPCQTFSVIGNRKGMADQRGQVIHGIIKILKEKNIKYFILENVKGLVNHDKGNTLKTILNLLEQAGYYVDWKILNSKDYGLPHSRERIYFVGIKKDLGPFKCKFSFPEKIEQEEIAKYLIDDSDTYVVSDARLKTLKKYLSNKYNLSKLNLDSLLSYEGYTIDTRQSDIRLYKGFSPTLRTGRHGILYVKNGKLREISGYESLLLQGIDRKFALKTKGKTQNGDLLAQSGNAMSVPVIEAIGKEFLKFINYNSYGFKTKMIQDSERLISKGEGYYSKI